MLLRLANFPRWQEIGVDHYLSSAFSRYSPGLAGAIASRCGGITQFEPARSPRSEISIPEGEADWMMPWYSLRSSSSPEADGIVTPAVGVPPLAS